MKSTLITITLAATLIFVACQKNDMMKDSLGVDTQKYYNQLNIDYSNALYNHNALITSSVSSGDHSSHHGGINGNSNIDSLYLKMMFNRNDSLFSEHFYDFCKDMMQNSGMMSTTNGMMGNNGGMMGGSGGMMNGTTMGSMADMTKMMSYMDSLHLSAQTMLNSDFMKADSLMHNQMTTCKMMTTQTDSISSTFGKMQLLRKNHKMLFGI